MALSKKNTVKPLIIDDETLTDPIIRDLVMMPTIDGAAYGRGYVPRDYGEFPETTFSMLPSSLTLIDPSEYDVRIDELERLKATLRHLIDWPSLDQNGQGFCWSYSTTAAVMALRKVMNQPFVRLSAHGLACRIKGFKDEGGWCGLSLIKGHMVFGCPSVEVWPEKSMSRQHDNEATWANAALHKVTESVCDLTTEVYNQDLTDRQIDTCSLLNIPMAWDFNWWGHSVYGCGLTKIESGSRGRVIRNSWSDQWGENGWAILRGSKANPDGAVALMVTNASVS